MGTSNHAACKMSEMWVHISLNRELNATSYEKDHGTVWVWFSCGWAGTLRVLLGVGEGASHSSSRRTEFGVAVRNPL